MFTVTLRRLAAIALLPIYLGLAVSFAFADGSGVVLEGKQGPLAGKHIVLVAGDDEYRSEELIPQLGRILAARHGCRSTVLFAVDPNTGFIDPPAQNIPGLEALDSAGPEKADREKADLLVIFTRYRELPDDQMKHLAAYIESGRPIIGLRTATHAFNYTRHKDSPYAQYSCNSKSFNNKTLAGGFGRQVLGETWINHYGVHNAESTRATVAPGREQDPIVRGVGEIWGPSDVYALTTLSGDSRPLVLGHVLVGMKPTDRVNDKKPPMPVAWTKTYTGAEGNTARVFTTTMGHCGDLQDENFRRLLVNACYWCLGLEEKITAKSNVDFVGKYEPNSIGIGRFKKNVKPSDYAFK